MKVCVIGTGYVGLVTGACLAETGHFVTCVDSDAAKVRKLKSGSIPFYEPGLSDMVQRNHRERRLRFATSLAGAPASTEVFFIAVGTPAAANGSSDIRQVLGAAAELGRTLAKPVTIVAKSTSPVGTADRIRQVIARELARRKLDFEFDLVSNPEFLKEGDAIGDFMRPDRVIVGAESERAARRMREPLRPGPHRRRPARRTAQSPPQPRPVGRGSGVILAFAKLTTPDSRPTHPASTNP